MSETQRELELEKANAAKSKAKAGSMAAKANMVPILMRKTAENNKKG